MRIQRVVAAITGGRRRAPRSARRRALEVGWRNGDARRALGRNGPHGELGHRGHHGGVARGARRHGASGRHQVRGLLPRARRQFPREGGIGCRHVRDARQPRRDGRDGARHRDRTIQRPRRACVRPSRRTLAASPRSSSSRSSATWAWSLPGRGSSKGSASCARPEGALLIFDEVMTGFRVARGGAQERYGSGPT